MASEAQQLSCGKETDPTTTSMDCLFWWKFRAQDDGKYEISLFDLEKKAWEQVVIDEYIPCKIVKGEPKASYAQPVGEELWVLLMEKAGTGHRELGHVEGFTKKPYWSYTLCQITSDTKVFDNEYIQHTGSIYLLNSPKPCFSSTHKYDTCGNDLRMYIRLQIYARAFSSPENGRTLKPIKSRLYPGTKYIDPRSYHEQKSCIVPIHIPANVIYNAMQT